MYGWRSWCVFILTLIIWALVVTYIAWSAEVHGTTKMHNVESYDVDENSAVHYVVPAEHVPDGYEQDELLKAVDEHAVQKVPVSKSPYQLILMQGKWHIVTVVGNGKERWAILDEDVIDASKESIERNYDYAVVPEKYGLPGRLVHGYERWWYHW